MTAEIAVMNRHGVALAADSAVTVTMSQRHKIYNTVNKLFMLSKHAPVGVMVYGQADITGVPWETIVKEFRRELGSTTFSTVEQYALALLSFLEGKAGLFPRQQEAQEILTHAIGFYSQILSEAKVLIHQAFASNGEVREGQLRRFLSDAIKRHVTMVENQDLLPGYSSEYGDDLVRMYEGELDRAIDIVFEKLPVGSVGRGRLKHLIGQFMARDAFPTAITGIVVTGYGEDEHFPSLHAYDTQSVLLGKAKHRKRGAGAIDADNLGAIYPFAQSEMVKLFMEGVDPNYKQAIETAIGGFLAGLPDALAQVMALPGSSRRSLEKRMAVASKEILEGFNKQLHQYSERNHIEPIVSAVSVLPKEELAEMAESLVNLTSFKRRVTMDAETVGGPIDVAVISKGDGFIWIRRKHYFRPELNPHFLKNYFG